MNRALAFVLAAVLGAALLAFPQTGSSVPGEGRDLAGERELAAGGDPSYGRIAALYPPFQKPREAVGVPAHPHDIGVGPEGRLELSDDVDAAGARALTFVVGEPAGSPFPLDRPAARRLVDGWMPIVILTAERGGLVYEEAVLGYSDGFRPQSDLWAYVRWTVRNSGAAPRATRIRGVFSPAGPAALERRLEIPAGGSAAVVWKVPFLAGSGPAAECGGGEFEARLQEARRFWKGWIGKAAGPDLPEPKLNDAWKAWLCYSSLDVDLIDGRYEAHDGVGFYEEIFGYSAALYAHALDLYGLPGEAARVLDALFSFQDKNGLYIQNYGLPDHGALLFAADEHQRITGDAAWRKAAASKVTAAGNWILRQRAAAKRDRPDPASPTFGLLKYKPYCDFPDPVFDDYIDAYTRMGLVSAADFLGRLDPAAGGPYLREADAYRRDILRSMDRSVIEREGLKVLPIEPVTQRLLKGTNYRGGGYYGLVASMLLESGLLPPDDPRAHWITDFMEKRGGLILGLCEFDGGIDHAYTYGYLMTALERGQIERVLLGFEAMLAYGMTRETFSGVECTKIKTGQNEPTLPHLYSATQQLRLLRMLLVREEGDGLFLGSGMPRAWLEPGKKTSFKSAPTAFGPMTVEFAGRGPGEISASVIPPPSPVPIRIRFRTPKAAPFKSVLVDGKPWTEVQGDVVSLGSIRGPVRVDIRY